MDSSELKTDLVVCGRAVFLVLLAMFACILVVMAVAWLATGVDLVDAVDLLFGVVRELVERVL